MAELFIGFLVGTAANRSQNALTALLDKMEAQEKQIETTEFNIVRLVKENTEITSEVHRLTSEIHQLSAEVAKNAAEVSSYIHSLPAAAGHEVGHSLPGVPPPVPDRPEIG